MGWQFLGPILVGWLALGSGPDPIRVPIGPSGELDIAEVVARLAERTGLDVGPTRGRLALPATGLAGALTRTVLAEALGPEVGLELRPDALIVTLPAAAPRDQLAVRLRALAARAREEAVRGGHAGMHARASYRPNDPGRPTVCLVHGLNSSSGGFVHLIPQLEAAGFGVVTYDYPFNRDLDESAPAFARDWIAARRRTGDRLPWAIVSHSMGGLLARWYVEGERYRGDVSDLVLIAPPNRGSAVAGVQTIYQLIQGMQSINAAGAGALGQLRDGLGEAAADDLKPGSRFLRALDARPRRSGVRYHILAGDAGFLTPEARRRIEARYRALARGSALLGGLARLAVGDLSAQLDELTDGTGDGGVAVTSTRLAGVADHVTIPANHVELIRGPLLYPDPGPVACMPYLLRWLGEPARGPAPTAGR